MTMLSPQQFPRTVAADLPAQGIHIPDLENHPVSTDDTHDIRALRLLHSLHRTGEL